MTSASIVSLIDDLQISALLAKAADFGSYDLSFCDEFNEINFKKNPNLLIVDLNKISEIHLDKIKNAANKELICIGYCFSLNNNLIKYFKNFGFDLIISRENFIKNINSILENVINGP